jgi:hypothetical protein
MTWKLQWLKYSGLLIDKVKIEKYSIWKVKTLDCPRKEGNNWDYHKAKIDAEISPRMWYDMDYSDMSEFPGYMKLWEFCLKHKLNARDLRPSNGGFDENGILWFFDPIFEKA